MEVLIDGIYQNHSEIPVESYFSEDSDIYWNFSSKEEKKKNKLK